MLGMIDIDVPAEALMAAGAAGEQKDGGGSKRRSRKANWGKSADWKSNAQLDREAQNAAMGAMENKQQRKMKQLSKEREKLRGMIRQADSGASESDEEGFADCTS